MTGTTASPSEHHVEDILAVGSLSERPAVRRFTVIVAGIAGLVDAIGFLALFGIFTAHMSGNSTRLGVSLGQGHWADAWSRFFPILVFVLSIAVATAVVQAVWDRRTPGVAWMLGAEFVLIAAAMVAGALLDDAGLLTPHSAAYYLIVALVVFAMGIQTAVLRKVGGLTVHTTFISGMLTQLAVRAVSLLFSMPLKGGDPDAANLRRQSWRVILLVGGIWTFYVAGACGGAAAYEAWRLWGLGVPLAFLAVVIGFDVVRGLPRTTAGS